jgi:hypothetical protein
VAARARSGGGLANRGGWQGAGDAGVTDRRDRGEAGANVNGGGVGESGTTRACGR